MGRELQFTYGTQLPRARDGHPALCARAAVAERTAAAVERPQHAELHPRVPRLTPGDAASFSTGHSGAKGKDIDTIALDELTFLLESGSDRVGVRWTFRRSRRAATRRAMAEMRRLQELLTAAERVEKGIPLMTAEPRPRAAPRNLDRRCAPQSSDHFRRQKYIAKFSSQNDLYSVVKARICRHAPRRRSGAQGRTSVRMGRAAGKDVLLVERFDREKHRARAGRGR